MRMPDLIAKKRAGQAHTPEELRFIAQGAAAGSIPDYQLSAWLMAVCWRSMTETETVALTRAMAESGVMFRWDQIPAAKVDKHSTGGVGDGVSIALAPLVAAAGLAVPMMSGRGLGHTGGTLDKLESIKGMTVRLPADRIRELVKKHGYCLFGQSQDLAPADRKLYALRDATSTVESRPLVVGSILSKKVAEGLDALVLDVKIGSGAIFQKEADGVALAKALVKTAKGLGLRTVAVLTGMDQPLGRFVGNALEVRQAVEVLRGRHGGTDYVECLDTLGGWMLHLCGAAKSPKDGAARMEELRVSGAGLKAFREIVAAQGGDASMVDDLDKLPQAPLSAKVTAPRSGFVSRLDARAVGQAAVFLGAGRAAVEDTLDYGAGIVLDKKVGDRVEKGELVATLLASDPKKLEDGKARFLDSLQYSAKKPKVPPLIKRVIR